MADMTSVKLARGSPIPMNTIWVMCSPSFSRWISSSTISPAFRFLTRPMVPVLQKAQPMAHPTWLDRQAVYLPLPSESLTHSTTAPSSISMASFTAESESLLRITLEERADGWSLDIRSLMALGRLVMAFQSVMPLFRAWKTILLWKSFSRPRYSFSSSFVRQ